MIAQLLRRKSPAAHTAWHQQAVAHNLTYPTSPCALRGHNYIRKTSVTWFCPVCHETTTVAA